MLTLCYFLCKSQAMKCDRRHRNGPDGNLVASRPHRCPKYRKVLDERKHPIRGLWQRNGRYHAQLTIEGPNITPLNLMVERDMPPPRSLFLQFSQWTTWSSSLLKNLKNAA